MHRVYLDNVITSGRALRDLRPLAEMRAVDELYRLHDSGRIKIFTSKMSTIEQERTSDANRRATLAEHRAEVSCVQNDHRLLGFNHVRVNYGGFMTHPLVTDIVDEPLFANLIREGLEDDDAKHLMYAFANDCQFFVTLDESDFIGRRANLEALCSGRIRIVRPSELVAELSAS